MTQQKLTDRTELTSTATGDLVHVVDVSDTTDSADGTSKKVQLSNLIPNSVIDARVTTGIAAHVADSDPHTQYQTAVEGATTAAAAVATHVALADPHTQYLPVKRQGSLYLPIGGRMRGLPGSGGAYDATNNTVRDQTKYRTPLNYAVKSIRLALSGFDISSQGEVDRANNRTGYASIYLSTPSVVCTTNSTASAGTSDLTFTPNVNNKNAPQVGMAVSGTNIPAGAYVTAVTPTYNTGNGNITSLTVTINDLFTGGGISSGQSITFTGKIFPATWAGVRQYTLEPRHDFLISDPIRVNIPADTDFFVRMFTRVEDLGLALAALPVSGSLTGEASQRGTDQADSTLTPVTPSNSGGGFVCPAFILAELDIDTDLPSVLVVGDSIAAGTGDTADAYGRCGYINKALNNTTCFASVARGGHLATQLEAAGNGQFAAAVAISATDVIIELCRNDIWNSYSASATLTSLRNAAAPYLAAGMKVWVTTCPPTTTSTDGWTTLVNQTISNASRETERNTYNTDIKANYASYGFSGVIDVCSVWESGSTGKWRVDLANQTTDGVHPSAAMHTLAQALVPVSSFGWN